MSLQTCWGLYEKKLDGHPLRVRLNSGIDEYVCHPRYRHQICINIILNSADEDGFPSPEECKLLDELELLLKDKLEQQQIAVTAAVVTSDGVRLIILYTYRPEYCKEVVADINKDWIYHQVSASSQEDKNWETIEALVENEPENSTPMD